MASGAHRSNDAGNVFTRVMQARQNTYNVRSRLMEGRRGGVGDVYFSAAWEQFGLTFLRTSTNDGVNEVANGKREEQWTRGRDAVTRE